MTNWAEVLGDPESAFNPYAGQTPEGEWIAGTISIPFLQQHFGQYNTASEMKAATQSEGLKLYFDWLVQQGILSE